MAYDVFISYRRETGGSDARLLQQALENAKRGYKVFFDYTSIRDGKFNDEIFDAIDSASVFILMVTRGVFDRCAEDGDWVRIELERAIDRGKKIVPVAPSDQTWCMSVNLPDKLAEIKYEQVSILDKATLFEESIDKMIEERFPDDLKRRRQICYSKTIPSTVSMPTPVFLGRDKELAKLHELLVGGKIPVVTGFGGTGKSQLAFHYAACHRTDYPGGLFQIDMEKASNWDDALQRLIRPASATDVDVLEILGIDKKETRKQRYGIQEIVGGLCRLAKRNGRVLLILDNVEFVKVFVRQAVLDRLSLPPDITMIVTARNSDIIFRQTDKACEFPLADLAPEMALKLLLADNPVHSDSELMAARRIAKILDYRVLNLRVVPEMLTDPFSPFCGSYVALEAALRKTLLETVDSAMISFDEAGRTPSSLWNFTRDLLSRHPEGSDFVTLARIASFFPPEGYEKKLLFSIWKEINGGNANVGGLSPYQALDLLRRHGLLEIQEETFRMHRLIREAIRRDALKSVPELEDSIGKVMTKVSSASQYDWLALSENVSIIEHVPSTMLNSHMLVTLLCKNTCFMDRFQLGILDGHDWVDLLVCQPKLADRCPWAKLDGGDWARLLGVHPQFADRCSWNKLSGYNWICLLGGDFNDLSVYAQPQFAERCPWNKLSNSNWVGLLWHQPQFADRCPWDELEDDDWASLLSYQPQFADKCPWKELAKWLDGRAWARLLAEQPQFADKCPWKEMKEFEEDLDDVWAYLLGCQPQFANIIPLNKLTNGGWVDLLIEQPQFEDKCPWEKFDGRNWAYLLSNQPKFAERCSLDILDGNGWALLLSSQPQFADRCSWNKLDGSNWSYLLSCQPHFAEKCSWERLNGADWARLLLFCPQFAEKCCWEKLHSFDWVTLLGGCGDILYMYKARPQFAERCPWEELDAEDLEALLDSQPQLATTCPLEKMEEMGGRAWARLLGCQPQFEHNCPWEKLDGCDWVRLLCVQPQFADRCSWNKLNGHNWAALLAEQPEFADLCPWEKFAKSIWEDLHRPSINAEMEMDLGDGWVDLFRNQPQLTDKLHLAEGGI